MRDKCFASGDESSKARREREHSVGVLVHVAPLRVWIPVIRVLLEHAGPGMFGEGEQRRRESRGANIHAMCNPFTVAFVEYSSFSWHLYCSSCVSCCCTCCQCGMRTSSTKTSRQRLASGPGTQLISQHASSVCKQIKFSYVRDACIFSVHRASSNHMPLICVRRQTWAS